jgi:hypothetical protein
MSGWRETIGLLSACVEGACRGIDMVIGLEENVRRRKNMSHAALMYFAKFKC